MKLIDRYIKLKGIYPDYVILIKCGNFYNTYYDDAILLQCLFKYKLCDNKVGFSINSLNKVKNRLRRLNIYILLVDNNSLIRLAEKYNSYCSIVQY